jgi:hypothetical protein
MLSLETCSLLCLTHLSQVESRCIPLSRRKFILGTVRTNVVLFPATEDYTFSPHVD